MSILIAVIYTASNDIDTEHTVWPSYERAYRAGADLARRVWAEHCPGEPFPDGTDEEALDTVRGALPVRLEVEPVDAPWLFEHLCDEQCGDDKHPRDGRTDLLVQHSHEAFR